MNELENIQMQGLSDNELIKKAFGEVLSSHRSAAGYQQRPFSRVVGISNSHLRSIESGGTSPTLVTLFKLAATLEESPCDLVGEVYETLHEMRPTTFIEYPPPHE